MKKSILMVAAIASILFSCSEENTLSNEDALSLQNATEVSEIPPSRNCAVMDVLSVQLQNNPGLEASMNAIEKHAYDFENYLISYKGKPPKGGGGNGGGGGGTGPTPYTGTINIPVVVHVIYSKVAENISLQQIQSQLDVLNEDYNAQNSDFGNIPSEFTGVAANVDINFTLAAITRKSSSKTSWGTRNDMKYASQGGVDAWDSTQYLNIWVCNIGGGILGYAQFPGGAAVTDGVVVGPNYFGRTGVISAPFDKGRTLTHEVGHWLNLRHIWGDGRCRADDYVSDTPSSDGPNYGCPSYPTINCKSSDMTMNYMDYVDDACMYMFSEGQNTRIRALFATGGARESFVK
ncbi:MAG: zinc metalloprotease [Flavobacteriaceae bacterium]|nr:zinc metalloprotease [Flavobacteriaceae bacterium]